MKKVGSITRRDFLRTTVGVTIAGAAGIKFSMGEESFAETQENRNSRVVLIRNKDALNQYSEPNGKVLPEMLDEAVCSLLDESNPVTAWGKLVKPGETVGIKSNVWRFLATPPELEHNITSRLHEVGVDPDKIEVDDRGVLKSKIFKNATSLINIRPMRSHHWSGVGGCIKNMIMFSPSPSAYHPDSCADLGSLFNLPLIAGKPRLHILVMLTPLFHGKGPHHFQKKYTWEYYGLLVSRDPVAVDATGLRILEAKRKDFFKDNQPFTVSPKHIGLAETRHRLGVADPSRIELIKLGWMEDSLI